MWGPGRHVIGHNVATYHRNDDLVRVEIFTEMDQMKDEALGYFDPRPWHQDPAVGPTSGPGDAAELLGFRLARDIPRLSVNKIAARAAIVNEAYLPRPRPQKQSLGLPPPPLLKITAWQERFSGRGVCHAGKHAVLGAADRQPDQCAVALHLSLKGLATPPRFEPGTLSLEG